jgi:hypothetical protein
MPSINLAELRTRAQDLAVLLPDAHAFRSSLRALMESHSSRLLLRGPSMARHGALQAWDVSGLLLRELEAALLPAAQANGDAALGAADAIWNDGRLEERMIAALFVGAAGRPDEARARIERWLKGMEDPALLFELAAEACRPLRDGDRELFRADLRRWIESRVPAERRFGWRALRAWLREKGAGSVPAAFDLLRFSLRETDVEAIRIAANTLALLAKFSPAETGKWLEDLPPELILRGRTFLRIALPSLPAETAAALRERMRRPV